MTSNNGGLFLWRAAQMSKTLSDLLYLLNLSAHHPSNSKMKRSNIRFPILVSVVVIINLTGADFANSDANTDQPGVMMTSNPSTDFFLTPFIPNGKWIQTCNSKKHVNLYHFRAQVKYFKLQTKTSSPQARPPSRSSKSWPRISTSTKALESTVAEGVGSEQEAPTTSALSSNSSVRGQAQVDLEQRGQAAQHCPDHDRRPGLLL